MVFAGRPIGAGVRVRPARTARAVALAQLLNAAHAVVCNFHRVLLSSGTGLLALTSVALGTYAGFSAQTTNPGNTFSTGTVQMTATLGNPSSATAFSIGTVSDLVPGESIVKFLDITNTGSLDFTYVMESAATTSSSLDTDATNGLQLEIKHCTVAWTGTDTCAGGTASTKYTGRLGPLAGSPVGLGTVTAGAGNVAYLQIRVTLPSSAGSLTGQTSTLQFTWTATNT